MKRLLILVFVIAIGMAYSMYSRSVKSVDVNAKPGQTMNVADAPQGSDKQSSRYIAYSPKAFADSPDKKRVYFFHATWCPSCKIADEEFTNNTDAIPEDVMVFKTDYDTQSSLKQQYGITYQHTFVYVDSNGHEIKKWNGGGIAELTANTRGN